MAHLYIKLWLAQSFVPVSYTHLWLVANLYEICDREPDAMEEMVRRSCDIKRKIVENDPTEKGERALSLIHISHR